MDAYERTYANGLTGEAAFLPMTRAEMRRRGWEQCDFVYVCGDAYVDHPSFGCAIICRLLEAHGFKVGIIAQPDWRDPASIDVFGEPRLGFMVSAGNMDSMVNHYTVAKRRRSKDYYSPGGQMGLRPDHAVVVYGNLIRRTYKKTPIIIGGIEASLRRLAHYDYWSDSLKRSILLDSGADLISYGMGEHSTIEIAEALDAGLAVQDLSFIAGTVYRARGFEQCDRPVILPTYEEMRADKTVYARSFGEQYRNLNPFLGHPLVEEYPHGVYVIQNPPSTPVSTEEFDSVYELPYARAYHPSYEAAGGIPAIAEIKFSLTSNRGCLGECAFCALNFHQGRIIQSRSDESLIAEAKLMTQDPDFKGYIHDVGGPTANFRVPACQKQLSRGACVGRRCLSPEPCKNLTVTHKSYIKLLRKLRALPGVKKVFVRSGIRFDYALLDEDHSFIRELAVHHTSGQLRLAPEHVSDEVLRVMGKPPNEVYQRFCKEFERESRAAGKEQYVVPYLMSSHPGSTMKVAVELAEFCRDLGYMPEQVSDFYPTPSTVSTCIYYTGLDPRTMEHVYCPTNPHEKAMQRALIQYRDPKNHKLVIEALRKAGREDLIGYGPKCLVRPDGGRPANGHREGGKPSGKRRGGGKPAGGRPASKGSAGGQPAGKRRKGEKSADKRRKGGKR
ncbi:MAG: YgiQ family radical SAM protein [Coriobacteriales bacterium]|nr:YgiQ family radical SAM protein [Coriobacteriales bacterium]